MGEIHGSFCNIFCNTGNAFDKEEPSIDGMQYHMGSIKPVKGCPSGFHSGKDIVFPAIIDGIQKVTKIEGKSSI